MQTFLPYANFYQSARVLDDKRLGKQRVEVLQILRTLFGETDGWRHHPVVKMWRGHETHLITYGNRICAEWRARGFNEGTTADRINDFWHRDLYLDGQRPAWLGDEAFHLSHRSNLVRKDPDHYGAFFPDTPDDLPYVWPV